MVDLAAPSRPLPLEELLLKHLRPGDILTHTYAHVRGRIPIVDEEGKVRAVCARSAQARQSSSMPAMAAEASCSGRQCRPLNRGSFQT